jgi:hypothetical protein
MSIEFLRYRLKQLYEEIAKMTWEEVCKPFCTRPGTKCCTNTWCNVTEDHAKKVWGIDLKPVAKEPKFYDPRKGCTVEPYYRPICSTYVCDEVKYHTVSMGTHRARYTAIIAEIKEIEAEVSKKK